MTADIEKEPLPSNETMSKKSDILDVVGGNGPWQRRIFLIIVFFCIPSATHNFSISFLAPNLDHWCARPSGVNISVEEWKRIALPPNDYHCSRILPESPRWLLSQGRVEEAQKTLTTAAKANGIDPSDIDTTLRKIMSKASEAHESGETSGNFLDLLRTPGLWQMTLNVYFLWFANVFVYYGLSYNTNELAGDPFINFALSGAVEFPAYVLSIIAIRSLGRRNPLAVVLITGGVACLLCYAMPKNPWWLGVAVSMIGKFCITCAFGIIFVFTAEIFPTVVRNIGLGSASMIGRFGSILAPFIRELGHATHPVVPQIVFCVLAVTSGMLVLLLPETNNCVVPDTIKEAANASRKKLRPTKHKNGHSVTTAAANGDAGKNYDVERMTPVTSLPTPSPKPQDNGKTLADVPEEEIHFKGPVKTVREPDDDPSEVAESVELETTQVSSPQVSGDITVETENAQSVENVPEAPENDQKMNL